MSQVVLTVGLMAYNEEKYLDETIASILRQDFDYPIEIIIADNASQDRTSQIAKSFVGNDKLPPNVTMHYYRHDTNLGALDNYNFLVRKARGDFFILAGAHDLWSAGYLLHLYQAIMADPKLVVVGPHTTWIDDTGTHIDRPTSFYCTSGLNEIQRFLISICGNQNCLYGIFRTEALKQTRLQLQILGSGAVMLGELALLGDIGYESKAIWYRRENRTKENARTRVSRYKAMLFRRKRWRPFPHWQIPISYAAIAFGRLPNNLITRFLILIVGIPVVLGIYLHLLIFDIFQLFTFHNAKKSNSL